MDEGRILPAPFSPYGMRQGGLSYSNGVENKYLYNGKELQDDDLGGVKLDWSRLTSRISDNQGFRFVSSGNSQKPGSCLYDYGARFYDPAIGRFFVQDRFAEKYYSLNPYHYGVNNPVLYLDVNGDSIYISHRKETIVYHEGQLYNKNGTIYNGKAYNKKGKLKGYVKQVRNALDNIRTGGDAGKELIDYFQNSDYKDIKIQKGPSNGERSGLITWNPTDKKSNLPNADDSFGRDPYIALAHEIGHSWDRWENGGANAMNTWYIAADGTAVKESEKIATWWENRIRAENGVGLRSYYSFINNNGMMQGEPAGRLIIPGTRLSEHINIFGQKRYIQPGLAGIVSLVVIVYNIPYKY